ncbi:rhomboid family intramembrane serine protease [Amycolatopsis taiwanensis]|uniref:Rhomboid family intramembrane serine protease n=1 Tax=Amycolatopsis taiwanensis TaxID=342230 RepID=A0A9W6VGV1_9PSEU|nr:rhomboid family intramembrane serine protease [Amycolatopsis taiwanensis]GLY66847.1 rhomboid family intramembrane serine protease [Amycolatopsis taiwanensis]
MSTSPVPAPVRSGQRILPPHPKVAGLVIFSFTALLYLVEIADLVSRGWLERQGIVPRTLDGLDGVIWAPLVHAGWAHLLANTVPVLVFGFLAMATGIARWTAVTATVWVVSGLGVWLTGDPGTTTIGASGVAFGWLAYLLVRGIFNRSFGQLLVAAVLLVLWGGTLWGLLPGKAGVSWQAHLFGAIGGVLAAWFAARSQRRRAPGNLVA